MLQLQFNGMSHQEEATVTITITVHRCVTPRGSNCFSNGAE
jgi:hypothetical protein